MGDGTIIRGRSGVYRNKTSTSPSRGSLAKFSRGFYTTQQKTGIREKEIRWKLLGESGPANGRRNAGFRLGGDILRRREREDAQRKKGSFTPSSLGRSGKREGLDNMVRSRGPYHPWGGGEIDVKDNEATGTDVGSQK